MDNNQTRGFLPRVKWGSQLENLAIVILAFYPLRHIGWGLDLWDTGYNYANFQYMGMRHMDPMWLFSTYLANVVGNLLTGLPNADMLTGMNLYTGLFASALGLTGYFFCTRKLKMPKAAAFVGEMAALSLCWCPTAVLYNYLTYVLFLFSCIFLYLGLTKEKDGYLVCAGALLGANVLVRFSNLPEAAMILAVWAYDFLLWLEGRKRGEGYWRRTVRHTVWCLAGYAGALGILLLGIHIRYGIQEYLTGIGRLFSMTDNATDYKPTAMLRGILERYAESLYWVVRLGAILAGGMALSAAAGWLEERMERRGASRAARAVHMGVRLLWAAVCIAMVAWLYARHFGSFLFFSYDSIWHAGPVFLILIMTIAMLRILHRDSPREEKLLAGMVILIVLLTPLGSNNGILPSLNNLFLAAPYVLWESWRFVRHVGDKKLRGGPVVSCFPVKGFLGALLAVCLFQFGGFGAKFAFAEGTGIQDTSAVVENNAVLRNVKMSPQRARWMTELSEYADREGLQGKEVILYGKIPALSYYLQMPSAFNPWSDLPSYGLSAMREDLAQLEERMEGNRAEKPVIILENVWALYEEAGYGAGEELLSEDDRQNLEADPKWELLLEFMETYGYEQTFRNEKFAVYR